MHLLFRPLTFSNVYDDHREKGGGASTGRDEDRADIRPHYPAIFAPITFLYSPISPLPFQTIPYPCFGNGEVLFMGKFRNGETLEFVLGIAEHFLKSQVCRDKAAVGR